MITIEGATPQAIDGDAHLSQKRHQALVGDARIDKAVLWVSKRIGSDRSSATPGCDESIEPEPQRPPGGYLG
jgi:hypothetical protein